MTIANKTATSSNGLAVNPSWTHTPVGGDPRGVLVLTSQRFNTDKPSAVTYGGVSMVEVPASPNDLTTGEPATITAWFLGSGIPAGAQTVAVTAANLDRCLTSYTVTAAGDMELQESDDTINSVSLANPSTTLSLGGDDAFCAIVFGSGLFGITEVSPLADWTDDNEHDFGSQVGASYSYDIIDSTDVTAGWTQIADDAVAIAVAIKESPAVVLTGTVTSTTVQQNIVDGGKTAKLTLNGFTFKAAGTGPIGSTADSQALLDSYVSAQSEAAGWNAEVSPLLVPSMLTRIDNENAELLLPAVPNYVITADEILTWTVPTDVLVSGGPIVATPTNTILSAIGGGVILNEVQQMQQLLLAGTSQIATVSIKNSTTGQGLTGLVFNTASLIAYYTRESNGTPVEIPLVTMTAGTWVSGGFVEVDGTNQKGVYQLGVPNALAAIGENYADISLSGAANMFDTNFKVELVSQLDIGSDNRSLVSANAHSSGQTIAGIAGTKNTFDDMKDFDSANDDVAKVNLVEVTTLNSDMVGTAGANTVTPDNAGIAQNNADIASLSSKNDTLAIPKNAIFPNFKFRMLLTSTNQPAIGVTVTAERNIDAAETFVDATGEVTEIGNGWYNFTSTAADANGDSIAWNFSAPDCNDAGVSFQTVR